VKRHEALGATRWDYQRERGYEFCVLQTEFPGLLARREPWTDEQAAAADRS